MSRKIYSTGWHKVQTARGIKRQNFKPSNFRIKVQKEQRFYNPSARAWIPKRQAEPYRHIEKEEYATLHFRVDYSSRKGHSFFMEDSYITMRVKPGETDDDIRDRLREKFEMAFKNEFGHPLAEQLDEESTVEGVERVHVGDEEVRFNYKPHKDAHFKTIKKTLSRVRWEQGDATRFKRMVGK